VLSAHQLMSHLFDIL